MLDFDYSARLRELTHAIDWNIRLPPEWDDFFDEKGVAAPCHNDRRRHQRLKARTPALLWFVQPLPAFPRSDQPIGIFTRDLSRRGLGLVTPIALYPAEIVRVVLVTFWVEVRVANCRRVNDACYIVGTELVAQYPASPEAFETPSLTTTLNSD